jgi:hypothetical protein
MAYNWRSSANFWIKGGIIAFSILYWSPSPVLGQDAAGAPAPDSAAAGPAKGADSSMPDPSLVRVTCSIESKYANAMLRQVARLFGSGFARHDADGIAHQIDALPADQKQLWQFATLYKGVSYRLQIRARVDDFGTVDLDFYVPAAIAKPVRSAVDDYLNKHQA